VVVVVVVMMVIVVVMMVAACRESCPALRVLRGSATGTCVAGLGRGLVGFDSSGTACMVDRRASEQE
jgi:hypothetical protein